MIAAAATATAGLQAVAGSVGTALVVLWFVIIGNASSGGPYARPLLPGFWRTVGGILPPGTGVDTLRGVLYFHNAGTTRPTLILLSWLTLGATIAFWRGERPTNPAGAELESAAAAASL